MRISIEVPSQIDTECVYKQIILRDLVAIKVGGICRSKAEIPEDWEYQRDACRSVIPGLRGKSMVRTTILEKIALAVQRQSNLVGRLVISLSKESFLDMNVPVPAILVLRCILCSRE